MRTAPSTKGTHWHAGWNMAGYLPETEPVSFDTFAGAYDYLAETVDRWLDQDYGVEGSAGDEIIKGARAGAMANGGTEPADVTAREILSQEHPTGEVSRLSSVDGWYGDIHFWAEPAADDDGCTDDEIVGRESD